MTNFVKFLSIFLALVSISKGQNISSGNASFISTTTYLGTFFGGRGVNLFNGPGSISHAPTNTSTTLLTPEDIFYFNYFSASSYCASQLQDLSCVYCQKFKNDVSNVTIINNATLNTLAYIVVQPGRKQIVVTFQGSYNLANFMEDLIWVQADVAKDIKIHRGFYIALMSLYYPVVKHIQIQLALNPTYKLVILGHGLGGSMASLTTFFLTYNNQFPGVPMTLVTFGQPRTGNKGFVDYMNKLTIPMTRVVSRADFFVHWIPVTFIVSLIGEPYYHHATEYWINGTASFCSNSVYEDPNCSDSLDPAYTPADHLQYLDADYAPCYLGDPTHLLSLPLNLLNTQTQDLPLLPKKIYTNVTEALIADGYSYFVPFFG